MNQHWRKPMNMNLAATHPAWILVMVGGFILWWPVGLIVLAWVLWSGSVARVNGQWFDRVKDALGLSPGNAAFAEHKAAVLRAMEARRKRLVEEEREFALYLDKLKMARDKQTFDDFVKRRKP
jgi:hypothetical protein